MPPKKSKDPIPVVAVKHKDKRANIPTKELRGFVEEDEKQPKAVLYPRDPSLDPQLVWKGKDEQDATLLSLILEVSGQRKKEKGAKVQTARTMWAPAVNNLGTFGRWAFLEIDGSNLHKTKQEIRKLIG